MYVSINLINFKNINHALLFLIRGKFLICIFFFLFDCPLFQNIIVFFIIFLSSTS